MFEKILLPLDGSRVAEGVLPVATELARKVGSQLMLVTACHPHDPQKHLLESYLGEKTEQLRSHGLDAGSIILEGEPAVRILDFAEVNHTGLVAVCTHGDGAASRWPLGSVAQKIVLGSQIPVMLVRATSEPSFLQKGAFKVLVPLDGSPVAESILPYVEHLAFGTHCHVVLLRIAEPLRLIRVGTYPTGFQARQYERDQRELIDHAKSVALLYLAKKEGQLFGKGIRTEVSCLLGRPAEAILQSAEDLDVDMIALASHGFSGMSRWAFGSVASRIVEGAIRPVLIVRPPLPSLISRRPASTVEPARADNAANLVCQP